MRASFEDYYGITILSVGRDPAILCGLQYRLFKQFWRLIRVDTF